MNSVKFKRGTVWYCDIPVTKTVNGQVVGEVDNVQGGLRPVLIVSNDMGNYTSPTVNILPITSSTTKKPLPCHVTIKNEKNNDNIILVEQIKTVNKTSMKNYLYTVSPEVMVEVEKIMAMQFGIDTGDGIAKKELLAMVEQLIRTKEAELLQYRTTLADDSLQRITKGVEDMIDRVKSSYAHTNLTSGNTGVKLGELVRKESEENEPMILKTGGCPVINENEIKGFEPGVLYDVANQFKEIAIEKDIPIVIATQLPPVTEDKPTTIGQSFDIVNNIDNVITVNQSKPSTNVAKPKKTRSRHKPAGFWTKEMFEEFSEDKKNMEADKWADKWEFDSIEKAMQTFYTLTYKNKKGKLV